MNTVVNPMAAFNNTTNKRGNYMYIPNENL